MKIASGALAALLLTGIGWSMSARAQGVPQGTNPRTPRRRPQPHTAVSEIGRIYLKFANRQDRSANGD